MGYAVGDDRRYTDAECLNWPEDARYELIDDSSMASPTSRS